MPRHVDLRGASRVERLHEVELDRPRAAAIVSIAIDSQTAHGPMPSRRRATAQGWVGLRVRARVGIRLRLRARPRLCARLGHSPAQPQDVLVDVLGLAAVGACPLDTEQALPEIGERA